MNRVPLRIESLAVGGAGVGRVEGRVVFVPFTAPGDLVVWRPVRAKSRFVEAELVDLLEAGEGRVAPSCPLFGECGGCQWQHLAIETQLVWKKRLLTDCLERTAGLTAPPVAATVASPHPWNYRSRAQFKCRMTVQGLAFGFYRRGSHYVVGLPPDGCPVCDPRINDVISLLSPRLEASVEAGRVPQVDVETDDCGTLRVVIHRAQETAEPLPAEIVAVATEAGWGLFLQQGRKSTLDHVCGPQELTIHPLENRSLPLTYGAGGFAQVNLEQNRRLVSAVLDMAGPGDGDLVLDLYCGNGNFGLPLARRACRVEGVEAYAPSIASARENARRNGIGNACFEAADVAPWLAGRQGARPALVILDPPRSGAREAIAPLLHLAPSRILYVSCDPATLARDLVPLVHQGYCLVQSVPFDLFPQTAHLESLTLLQRNG